MTEPARTSEKAVVVDLAAYRAARATQPAVLPDRSRVGRLPSPREVAHRRRMLLHLAEAGYGRG